MREDVIVQFDTVQSTATITRPATTTVYAAGDVVGEQLVFPEVAHFGKLSGLISGARITSSANQSTKLDAELWLFPTSIASLDPDNSPWTPTDAEMALRLGVIDFPVADWRGGDATAGAGGNAGCDVQNLGLIFRAYAPTIYGVLVARNAYTPVSEEVLTVDLMVTRD